MFCWFDAVWIEFGFADFLVVFYLWVGVNFVCFLGGLRFCTV